jgi:superfamily II DNA/RNA helicase
VVLSDDDGSSERIEEFAAGRSRWMVAVRMVSEGVDIPRLAVGVYATSAATPLYFAQAIGRFVRMRRRGETASIFLPSVPVLLDLAAQLEVERDHALDRPAKEDDGIWSPAEDDELAAANRAERASDELEKVPFQALDSSATFDRVLFDKQEFGTEAEVGSQEEQEFLGIPGLLDADQVTTLLRQRQAAQLAGGRRGKATAAGSSPGRGPSGGFPSGGGGAAEGDRAGGTVVEVVGHRQVTALRKELHSLVGAWARRTGEPHGAVHARLRASGGGPDVPQASVEQLQQRIDTVRRWFVTPA